MPYDHKKKLQRFSVNKKRYALAWPNEADGNAWEVAAKLAIRRGQPVPGIEDGVLGTVPVKQKTVGGRDAGTVKNCFRSAVTLKWEPKGDGAGKQILNADIFVRWVGPETPARDGFSQDKINEFIEYLKTERRVGNNTINKYMSAVRVMMAFAHLDRDETPTLPWYDKPEGRVRFFTQDECDMIERQWRLWDKGPEADFFVFLLDTGGRPYIDAKRLHWTNVFNPTRGGRPSVHFIKAKGGNARTVALTPRAWAAVQRQDKAQAGPWAWTDKDAMRRLWSKTQATFPQLGDSVLYCTRHTFGTELYRRSRDMKFVKDMMGHRNYTTTEIYVHIVGDDGYDRVADLMGKPAPTLVADGGAV